MSTIAPKQVTDKTKRTKIFAWKVPLQVGATSASVNGTLFWAGTGGGGAPVAAYAGLALVALLGLGAVLVVRRRRGAAAPVGAAEVEAW
jgi:LPXTG-motif cell wall-anchored protein